MRDRTLTAWGLVYVVIILIIGGIIGAMLQEAHDKKEATKLKVAIYDGTGQTIDSCPGPAGSICGVIVSKEAPKADGHNTIIGNSVGPEYRPDNGAYDISSWIIKNGYFVDGTGRRWNLDQVPAQK